ncbi:aminomethyltransferase beta-barrel domain-containing protein [Escherichia coli]|uniref:aminomethyltransferase beta-barrel domain-containing protein n=1 Tax=Escherichia coli TaxID=562 RepID=UPI003305AB36
MKTKASITVSSQKKSYSSTGWTNITQNENGYIFEFSAPQWAPAVGQSLVLFQENECLGGGVISEIH